MGIIERIFRARIERAVEAAVSKSAGFMTDETASYHDRQPDAVRIADYPTFIRCFRSMPWIYAAGTALAVAATKPDLKCFMETRGSKGTEQQEIEGKDINALLERPNTDLSYRELIQVTVINLKLLGNAYWNLVGTKEGQPISPTNPPVEIWWVKPEQLQPTPDETGAIVAYEFTSPAGKKRKIDAADIIHFRLPNPGSYFTGIGMMEPLTNTAILEANAVSFMRNFMANDATPPFAFSHPGSPTPEQRREFFRAWDERHQGPNKNNRPGMLWGGMGIEKIGDQTIKDIQYPELRKMNREEFLAGAGVPPSIVGLLEYANYSNMEVQEKKFWEDEVMPILGIVADKCTLRLAPLFDERFWFEYDFSKIKVLQEDDERRSRIANNYIGCGMRTPNQLIKQFFNEEGYPGGDQYYMNMSLLPVGEDSSARARALTRIRAAERKADEGAARGSFWTTDERKTALWKAFERRVASMERAMIPEVEKYLSGQADRVYAAALEAGSPESITARDLFDVDEETKAYAGRFEARYRQAFERAGNAGYQATKGMIWIPPEERKLKDADEFKVTAEHLAKLRAQIEKAAKFFNETTWDVVKAELERLAAESPTVQEIANALKDKLEDRAHWEARRISRTEMCRTENWGGTEGYRQNEFVNNKGWLCSRVEDSRDAHVEADGQEVGIDEDFFVGGEALAYPGDPKGAAGNVVNCLCTTYPIVSDV